MEEPLTTLLEAHTRRSPGCVMTMLTFDTESPRNSGIVEVDNMSRVIAFYEKMKESHGHKANCAVYAFENEMFDHLKGFEKSPKDFSTEVIPTLLGKIQTVHTTGAFIDIGTPSALEKARDRWGG